MNPPSWRAALARRAPHHTTLRVALCATLWGAACAAPHDRHDPHDPHTPEDDAPDQGPSPTQDASPELPTRDMTTQHDQGPDATLDELPDPRQLGASYTLRSASQEPFLSQAPTLSGVALAQHSQGRELFMAPWAPAGQGPALLDGVGPHLHADACLSCHPAQGRPLGLGAQGRVHAGLLVRLGVLTTDDQGQPRWAPEPSLGGQLQPLALPGMTPEGVITWRPEAQAPQGLERAHASAPKPLLQLQTAWPLDERARWGARYSPQLAGLGLLERIPEQDILALEDPEDLDHDGVRGRAARVWDAQARRMAVGRFGWKAAQPTLLAQTAAALAHDMGLTSWMQPKDDCTPRQVECLAQPQGGSPEVSDDSLALMAGFVRGLGVPPGRYDARDARARRGATLLREVGCTRCHVPAHRIELEGRQVQIWPYTDLLLHDMGPGLCEELGEGDATGCQWRTPPLWGVGLVAARPEGAFLHDGRARTLLEAILWHDGEARGARQRFEALSWEDASALLALLSAL